MKANHNKGSSNPSVYGSLINEFSWKGFSLSINLSYKFGYYFKKTALDYTSLFYYGATNKDFSKRWQKPGDELITNVPAMQFTDYPEFTSRDEFYKNSEINVLKGDHIRLQYVNLEYNINKIKNLVFQRLQLYFNAANLGFVWRANKEGLDPDQPTSYYPIQKSYTFGIRASF